MYVPSRHITKKKVEVEPIEKPIKILAAQPQKDNSPIILAEVKRIMAKDKKPTKWVFDMIRDSNGDLTQVIANAVDTGTII